MKVLLPFIFTACCFTSCTSFQYLTINSHSLPYTNKQFVNEKDSLQLRYSFDGYKGVLLLDITNNSSRPVTIDWKKSAVITNGITQSLFNSQLQVTATAAYDTLQRTLPVQTTAIEGNISISSETDFIPPFSTLKKRTVQSIGVPLDLTFNNMLVKETSLQQTVKIPGQSYTPQTTPCNIRVYLTYHRPERQNNFIENSFFVSEILQTTRGPLTMDEWFGQRQSVVYTY